MSKVPENLNDNLDIKNSFIFDGNGCLFYFTIKYDLGIGLNEIMLNGRKHHICSILCN